MINRPIQNIQKNKTYSKTQFVDVQFVEPLNYRGLNKGSYFKPTQTYSLSIQEVLKFMSRSPPPCFRDFKGVFLYTYAPIHSF